MRVERKKSMSNLVIVESPTKATTIKSFLGSGYKVVACQGHVRDLPKSTLGVEIEKDFQPKYINIRGKGPLIAELKKEVKNADKVFLASDPDREGEAISWHLSKVLGLEEKNGGRITFNEITKNAVKSAIASPRPIDMALVDSQQTRRILDRIVGYKLSPLLWKNVQNGLSAGRVQSVATRLVVDREREIRAFNPQEYWTISALLKTSRGKDFTARFHGTKSKKSTLKCKEDCENVLKSLEKADFSVAGLEKSTKKKNPAPPFTTSQLQQEAFKRLNFQSKRTMRVAQSLYEGLSVGKHEEHGLITYMRTDSLRVSAEAQSAAKSVILSRYGEDFYPAKPRVYKSKGSSQDAHEAIRPTDPTRTPESLKEVLSAEQYRLYKLIWERFIASQMESAVIDVQSCDIEAACSDGKSYIFKAAGENVRFAGFMKIYGEIREEGEEKEENKKLPALEEKEKLSLSDLSSKQNFTQPPRRYTEATLVAALEEKGIGRPSTYTPTLETIINRGYIARDKKQLVPTKLGEVTNEIMEKHFASVVDYEFTANLEKKLDDIAEGKENYTGVLGLFYGEFKELLENAEKEFAESGKVSVPDEELDIECPKCGRRMIVKHGRFGKFAACPGYPECKTTMALDKNGKVAKAGAEEEVVPGEKCEICGGEVIRKKGRFGEFLACRNYPECRYTKPITKKVGVLCPKCGGDIVEKHGRKSIFYGCSNYPNCDFSLWDLPLDEKCPECQSLLVKKKNGTVACSSKECKFTRK